MRKIAGYLLGLNLWPHRMMGETGKYTWVVFSSHPLWSITWTWVLYWRRPNCPYWRGWWNYIRYGCGFDFRTQKAMPWKEAKPNG